MLYQDDSGKRVIRDSHLPQDSIQELLGLYRDKRISSKNQGITKEPGASENSSSGVKQVLADTSRQNKPLLQERKCIIGIIRKIRSPRKRWIN